VVVVLVYQVPCSLATEWLDGESIGCIVRKGDVDGKTPDYLRHMECEVVQFVQVVAWVCAPVVHHQRGASNRLCIDVLGYFFVCHDSLSLLIEMLMREML